MIWFFYAVFCFVAGAIGSQRRCGFWTPFLLSIFLTPLVGLIIAFASTRLETIEFQRRMLEASGALPKKDTPSDGLTSRQREALIALEDAYKKGAITVYDYEQRKDAIMRL